RVRLGVALGDAAIPADLVGFPTALGTAGRHRDAVRHLDADLAALRDRALLADRAGDPLLLGLRAAAAARIAAIVPPAVAEQAAAADRYFVALPVADPAGAGHHLGVLLIAMFGLHHRARLGARDPDGDGAILGHHLGDSFVGRHRPRPRFRDRLTA